MRKQKNWFPLYGDETCIPIVMKGVWTSSKAGKTFCQKHGAMLSTCKNCGRKFHSERGHTETCSNKCRMQWSRKQRKSVQSESVTGGK